MLVLVEGTPRRVRGVARTGEVRMSGRLQQASETMNRTIDLTIATEPPRTGPPSRQATGATDAGVQSLRVSCGNPCRDQDQHMIRKGQLRAAGKLRPAQQFYSLAS